MPLERFKIENWVHGAMWINLLQLGDAYDFDGEGVWAESILGFEQCVGCRGVGGGQMCRVTLLRAAVAARGPLW